jgi:hypothetical protein
MVLRFVSSATQPITDSQHTAHQKHLKNGSRKPIQTDIRKSGKERKQ